MKALNMLLLLTGFAATATACTTTRTVEVVTKPAPAAATVVVESARPSHYRLVAIDDRRAEAIFEAVSIVSPALADAEDSEIQRQSGFEPLVVPIDRLSKYLTEGAEEVEVGTLFDAFYSGDGTLERLAPHGE